jgi:hypothetical protein
MLRQSKNERWPPRRRLPRPPPPWKTLAEKRQGSPGRRRPQDAPENNDGAINNKHPQTEHPSTPDGRLGLGEALP